MVQHYGRLRAVTINTSNSPFSENILECEFPKKFTAPASDYNSDLDDPIQHLSQYQDKMVIYARNNPSYVGYSPPV